MRVHVDMMLVVRRVPVNTRPSVCTVARDTVMILMLQSNHLWFHSILVCFPRLHRHWQTSRHLLVSIHRMDRKRLQYQQAINLHHPVRWYCRQPASVTLRHLGINTRSSAGIETLCGWSWSISTGKEAVTSSVLTYLLYYITTRVPMCLRRGSGDTWHVLHARDNASTAPAVRHVCGAARWRPACPECPGAASRGVCEQACQL